MDEGVFDALRHAVNVARNERPGSVAQLRKRLVEDGFAPAEVDEALRVWSKREAGRVAQGASNESH